jgi:CubicO group peptidase (beta-lactamase class C family)
MKKTILWLWIVILALGTAGAVRGQTPDKPQAVSLTSDPRFVQSIGLLEAWIDAKLAYDKIPGISLGFVVDQDLVWRKGYGYADVQRKAPATPKTLYSICSISKLFTSIAVMQLKDEGKLQLDDPVAKHLPWFTMKPFDPDSPPVTIRGLLTHSAGIPREADQPYWTGPDFRFPSREDVIKGLSNQSMLYPSSRYFQYSNLGLTLAGQIVEQVSGKPYADYVRENILGPLHLGSTTPEIPVNEQGKLLAIGYGTLSRDGERPTMPVFQARGIAPAAGFASNVEDLARFASWQFRLLAKGGQEVLKASTLREMQRVQWMDPDWKTSWGLGFTVMRLENRTVVGHGGSCPGFRTELALLPDEMIAGIAMVNAMGVDPNDFVLQMIKILSPALQKIKDSPGQGKAADPTLQKFTGLYRSAWGEVAVIVWDDGLAAVELPGGNPLEGMEKMKWVEGLRFQRIRSNGEPGEEITFEVAPDGRVLRFKQHGNYTDKVR